VAEDVVKLPDVEPLPGEAASWAPGEAVAGMPSADGGAGARKRDEVTGQLADIHSQKVAEADKIYGELTGKIDAAMPRIEQLSKDAGAELANMKPWDAEAESAKRSTDPIAAFGSFASVAGILASVFTRQPIATALDASAAAMNAIRAGDDKAYERAHQAWQDNQKLYLDRHKIQHQAYQDAVSLLKTNMDVGNTKLAVLAARFGDKQVQTLLEAGMNKEVEELLAARERNALAMAKLMPEVFEENAKMQRLLGLGYDPKNPQSEKSQKAYVKFQEELAEFKRKSSAFGGASNLTGDRQIAADVAALVEQYKAENPNAGPDQIAEFRAQEMRRLKAASSAPSGNRIDDLRSKIDQTKNIIAGSEKQLEFLRKYKGGAGLFGKIMRGEEIAENIAGISTKSDRAQFRRRVLELQDIVPRILTDSTGRPLASAQAKVDAVVAGLAAGDTGPNTIRAYEELIADMKHRMVDYDKRVTGSPSVTTPSGEAPKGGARKPSWQDFPEVK
jgi:hypothetical protein